MIFSDAKVRKHFADVTEGKYTIIGVSDGPVKAKYPSITLQLSREDTCSKHSMLTAKPKPEEMGNISPFTSFGRLIQAFGNDTDSWLGKKIEIRIDDENRKHIYPI
jgi:hypothetical protein